MWAVKYIIDKIKSAAKDSGGCSSCKCEFPVDAIHRDIFFLYVTIDGKKKKDIEACDYRIFSEIFRELERMGLQHNVSQLSFPDGYLTIAYINVAELGDDILRDSPHGKEKKAGEIFGLFGGISLANIVIFKRCINNASFS